MESPLGSDLTDAIAAAARLHAEDDPGYLAKIRRATGRLGISGHTPDDARSALAAVEDCIRIDVDAPTAASRREAALLKQAVKRLTAWYLGYVGDQITALGQAIVRYGTAMADRADRLDETVAALRDDVVTLTARVERLEQEAAGG